MCLLYHLLSLPLLPVLHTLPTDTHISTPLHSSCYTYWRILSPTWVFFFLVLSLLVFWRLGAAGWFGCWDAGLRMERCWDRRAATAHSARYTGATPHCLRCCTACRTPACCCHRLPLPYTATCLPATTHHYRLPAEPLPTAHLPLPLHCRCMYNHANTITPLYTFYTSFTDWRRWFAAYAGLQHVYSYA